MDAAQQQLRHQKTARLRSTQLFQNRLYTAIVGMLLEAL